MKTALQILLPATSRADAESTLHAWLEQEGVLAGRVIGPEYGRGHWLAAVYLSEPDDPEVHLPYEILRCSLPDAVWNMLEKPDPPG